MTTTGSARLAAGRPSSGKPDYARLAGQSDAKINAGGYSVM